MSGQEPLHLLRSMGELSELALAIGSSIDLVENCEYFFQHLLSRKNLSAASVWTSGEAGYERVYTYPEMPGPHNIAAADLDWQALLGEQSFRVIQPTERCAASAFVGETDSAIALRRCPEDIGFIVLHSYLWLTQPISVAEERQLTLLLSKFMRSIKGCLVHRELLEEMAAHKQSQERERELKYRIDRMKRLENISEIIGHTAHDLNNLFGPVVSYPEMILDALPAETSPEVIQDIKAIEVSARAAVSILNDLLSISRSGRRVSEEVHLPAVVDAFSRLASFRDLEKTHANIRFSFEIEEQVPCFIGAAVQCTQALLNLIVNACEEMPDGGDVATAVRHVVYAEKQIGYEEIPAGHYIVLEVRDNAGGIPADILDRIFEPYVSRKEMGRSGSGLGLAVVYGVVKHADGFVDIETETGVDTCFRLHFPARSG